MFARTQTARDADRQGRRCCLDKGAERRAVLRPSKASTRLRTRSALTALQPTDKLRRAKMPNVRFRSKVP